MLARFLTEPGFGGLIVMVALVVCLSFYGSLIVWIVRARPSAEATLRHGRQQEPQRARLEGARS